MKKTLLALTVTTLFTGTAMASTDKPVYEIDSDLVKHAIENVQFVTDKDGKHYIYDKENNKIGDLHFHRDEIQIVDANNDILDINTKNGDVRYTDDNGTHHGKITDMSGNNPRPIKPNSHIDVVASKNGAKFDAEAGIVEFTKGDYKGFKIDAASGAVFNTKGEKVAFAVVDKKNNVSFNEVKDGGNNGAKIDDAKNEDNWRPNNDVIEVDSAINEAIEGYNADVATAQNWAAYAEQQFKQEVARLDAKIDNVEGRVSNGAAMAGAMTQMQFGHDGFGVGAGVANFNGSNAIAVGVGYAFGSEKQWMAKGSFGYAKSNKGNKSADTMAAAGLTYSFK